MSNPVRVKTGLAGYVRTGPRVGSFLVAVFLLPFWLSSEITQASWAEWRKVAAITVLWAGTLGAVAMGAERSTEPRSRAAPTVAPSKSGTPTPTEPPATVDPTPTAPPTTSPPTTERPRASAEDLLSGLIVAAEPTRIGYDRDLFDHWNDDNGDGCDTRREVLIAESLEPVTLGAGCDVTRGRWYSPYDGLTLTEPSRIDIDHFVPLAEAWDSGAHAWTPDRREEFANDLGYEGSLIAVSDSSNQSKSDRDPAEWQPRMTSFHCRYARTWIAVKLRWTLTADAGEISALGTMLDRCE